ncbi:hypothetical protein U1839_20635 [Sphingomonas sp. RT2P30]|uniref:hypothetical protein n=1 Tax=Parasphingomonas halimpatiens TaxID=3096162 RepID=UPI002FCC1D19
MTAALKAIHTHAWDFWLARLSVVVIACLQLLMINDLTFGPRWLAPGLEVALLLPLSVATAWTQITAREARTDAHWRLVARARYAIRLLALTMTALITLINFEALIELVHALLNGNASKVGQTLLLDALNIWATNVIIFALWFWTLDRGGPASHGVIDSCKCDFLFPHMTMNTAEAATWKPGFIDYLYLAFTNATAFSPTDTLPLSRRAKLMMMFESAVSLLTIALVAARAVNILA